MFDLLSYNKTKYNTHIYIYIYITHVSSDNVNNAIAVSQYTVSILNLYIYCTFDEYMYGDVVLPM